MKKLKQQKQHLDLTNLSTLSELCFRHPECRYLLEEWHQTLNRNMEPYNVTITPDSVTPTDDRMVWWKCRKGHHYKMSVKDRVNGEGCIFCKPEKIERQKMLFDYCSSEVPDGEIDCSHLLKEWDYEKNYPLTPKDVRTVAYRKVWWKCEKGHSWQQLISNRVKVGVGCPYCGNRRLLKGFNDLATLYPEIAAEWDCDKNERKPDEISSMTARKAWWICSKGHSYQKIISNRTRQGQGCPICLAYEGKFTKMLIKGVNDFATTHPELLSEWNWERNDALGIKPDMIRAGSDTRVWWKCKNGHEWETPISRRTGKRKIGCPGCSGLTSYKKNKEMGCTKGFPHFSQPQNHVRCDREQPTKNGNGDI